MVRLVANKSRQTEQLQCALLYDSNISEIMNAFKIKSLQTMSLLACSLCLQTYNQHIHWIRIMVNAEPQTADDIIMDDAHIIGNQTIGAVSDAVSSHRKSCYRV
ncbi:hypothetical protein BDEG_26748 [Batrachochytrium dendrobatidis JEL423]|uniref:Uncharacterized protein n=1 Tax=Batrachochytrium dendrobatidis (strain JEL423) TaxID=403673 RepID=A0A177WTG0_BATDL|nr:hypothetical protein BDEG_26748 [Batrachochytrium dendrobatidis JEL423]